MMDQKIIDGFNEIEKNETKANFYLRKHLWIAALLIMFNLLAFNLFVKTGFSSSVNLNPEFGFSQKFLYSCLALLIAIPLLCVAVAIPFGLLPYKKLRFAKKYPRSYVLTLLSINLICTVALIVIIARTIIGWSSEIQENISEKEDVVNLFKLEMNSLSDSLKFYYDFGLEELDKGVTSFEVSKIITPKREYFVEKMDTKSVEFSQDAKKIELSENEYKKVFDDLNEYNKQMIEKYFQLMDRGVNIK